MAQKVISHLQGEAEDADERILSHNLQQMHSTMMRLLNAESIGGNAGFVRIRGRTVACAAARGFADVRSGEIIIFGNYQDIPKKIRDAYAEFILRIAVDVKRRTPSSRIVGCSACAPFSNKAKRMLRASVERWNEQCGIRSRAARKGNLAPGAAGPK
jgi:hypothetical protein